MSRKKSSTRAPTITLAALARCAGIPVSTLYARQPEARGPILLSEAITFLEGELATLYADKPRARKIRKLEDGLRELRVQRAMECIRDRQRRIPGGGHSGLGRRSDARPHYDPETGALLSPDVGSHSAPELGSLSEVA